MTIPVWVLLGFAAWTLLTLFTTIGVYRWTRILTGRASIAEWRADEVQGTAEWYRRALRAHMNCVENLPVYTATVVVLLALRLDRPVLDALAITILVARICQTSVHLSFEQTNPIAAIRFAFFFRADGLPDRNGRYRCRRGRFIILLRCFSGVRTGIAAWQLASPIPSSSERSVPAKQIRGAGGRSATLSTRGAALSPVFTRNVVLFLNNPY
jgi:uncharacterized MAPEG superfamily protein